MATGLTVGGWFASAFLQTLVDKAGTYAVQQFGDKSGIQKELKKLKTSLWKVRVLIDKAERWGSREESLADLLNELKDAAYDADDLLDEFQYEELKLKVESEGGGHHQQISGFFPSGALNFATQFFEGMDVASRIREIQERLDCIAAEMKEVVDLLGDMGTKQQQHDQKGWRPETTSFPIEAQVFGRDEEIQKVIELLLKSGAEEGSESSNESNVCVLSIVGMGGVGKTTLAQRVYHDQKVEEYFQLRAWVCVSDPFDVKRLVQEFIQSLPGERCSDVTNLNQLQVILKEKLMSKRFLLGLDDVWNGDKSKWESLFSPLSMFGGQGSKIIVTTRSKKVVDTMAPMELVSLGGLAEDAYWSFFKKCAFGCQSSENHLKLEAIGKKIAQRLKGSPLAATTLGSLLNSDLDEQHWRNIMDSEIWELRQGEHDILPVLKLSYQYLPAYLKQCFAYCCLFPKDHLFNKAELVKMWMAQGFIAQKKNERMEDVGSEYFDELLCRSFFQKHSRFASFNVMHDLLHDLAQSVSIDECFRLEDGKSQMIPSTVRHLSVCTTTNVEPSKLMKLCNFKKLRTLVFLGSHQEFTCSALDKLFGELKSIRLLIFAEQRSSELPDSVGSLKHLKYLYMHCKNRLIDARKIVLPKSLCNLYNLQVLNMQSYRNLEFPQGMEKLIKLRHLVVCHQFNVRQPAEIGRLTSLQQLAVFRVSKKKGHKVGELQDLKDLRGSLRIRNLENVDDMEEACQAKLNNKKHLDELCLKWGSKSYDRTSRCNIPQAQEDILEGLQPHSNLKKLVISNYGGVRYPRWLESDVLSNLESVTLQNLRSLEQLPCLGQFPSLKVIKIKDMDTVRQIGDEVYGSSDFDQECCFPSLEHLEFQSMPEWEEWPDVSSPTPSLNPGVPQAEAATLPPSIAYSTVPTQSGTGCAARRMG